ncbi:MAG: glycoside hydrolase, partial [Oscillospiraceae bacterium]|nr:glycoside hydrolase [Oscillospiraceae bacterium]
DSKAIKPYDVDQNGKLEVADIVWFSKYLLGDVTAFPEKAAQTTTPPEDDPPQDNPPQDQPTSDGYVYPENVQIKEFPGDYTNPAANRGQVIEEKYTGINGPKTMYVYLPPNYDENKKYNVFYLMHGGGENEKTCFFDSSTQFQNIFDHMIAAGELDPLIVVTPTFNNCPNGSYDVYDEMKKTIVPYVEGKYSTYAKSSSLEDLQASRYHRAYGGFSMGGGSTWITLIHDLDIFAYFMPLSGHNWGGVGEIQQAIDSFGYKPDEYYIFAATGSEDIAHGNMVPQINEMKADTKHFIYTSDFSKGNFYFLDAPGRTHWWGYVRHYVYDALPLFFHEHQND